MIHCFMWKCIHYLFVYHCFPNLLLANASELQNASCREHSSDPTPPTLKNGNPSLMHWGKGIHLRSTSSVSAKEQLLSFFLKQETPGLTTSLILKQSCHTLAELSELCAFMPVLGGLPEATCCGRDLVGDPVTLMKHI